MATTSKSPTGLLTVRQVAKQLQVDDTTVRRWIKGGLLQAITLPRSGRRNTYRIDASTLERIMQNQA